MVQECRWLDWHSSLLRLSIHHALTLKSHDRFTAWTKLRARLKLISSSYRTPTSPLFPLSPLALTRFSSESKHHDLLILGISVQDSEWNSHSSSTPEDKKEQSDFYGWSLRWPLWYNPNPVPSQSCCTLPCPYWPNDLLSVYQDQNLRTWWLT